MAESAPMKVGAMPLLVDIRDSDSKLGMDIGGTLAKMVIALPDLNDDDDEESPSKKKANKEAASQRLRKIPSSFGESGRCRPELIFQSVINNRTWTLQFIRGSTHLLVPLLTKNTQLKSDTPEVRGAPRQVIAAGGGAHKFKDLFLKSMHIELVALKEFQSLVDGLRFLHAHQPPQELYTVTEKKTINPNQSIQSTWNETIIEEWPVPLYPFLLVSFGSGVSVLQVNSAAESDYERVGGTATGGATFLGLMNLLSRPHTEEPLSFDDIVALAARGNPRNVDKLVGDIYGEDGCANLGLPPTMTAANFGKLASQTRHFDGNSYKNHSSHGPQDKCKECSDTSPSLADIAAATLQMISQASAVLVRTIAQQAKCLTRVFVVGGFMDANPIARKVFAQNLAALKGRAIFVKHSGYLGSLGSLHHCLFKGGTSRQLDPAFYNWDLGGHTTSDLVKVREITCPTDIVARRRSSSSAPTTPTDTSPSSSQTRTAMFSAGPSSSSLSDTVIKEEDERHSDISQSSDMARSVSNNSLEDHVSCPTEGVSDTEGPIPFPTMHHDFILPLKGGNAAEEDLPLPPAKVSDANYWWQFALNWAYAASFSLVRNNDKLEKILMEHGIIDQDEEAADKEGDKQQNGDWRFSECIRCLDRCIQLEPRCAMAFWALSWVHGHRKLSSLTNNANSSSCEPGACGGSVEKEEKIEEVRAAEMVSTVLSMESAHFASRRAVGLLRAGKFTKCEEALIETNGLRFALWPPCEYANYLSLSYAAAMRCAYNRFNDDPDIVTTMVRSKLDVLDSTEVENNFNTAEDKAKLQNNQIEYKLLSSVETALKVNENHIGLLIAHYSLLGRICVNDQNNQDILLRIKETKHKLDSISRDGGALYLSAKKSWQKHGRYQSLNDDAVLSPRDSRTCSSSGSFDSSRGSWNTGYGTEGRGSFGGNAAMGRLRGISYGVIIEN